MRRILAGACRRNLVFVLAVWIGLFSVLEGAHVPSVRLADDSAGASGHLHDPTHRHELRTAQVQVHDYSHDRCPVCLAHPGFHALPHDTAALHPAGLRASGLARLAGRRALGTTPAQPPSRAPPQI